MCLPAWITPFKVFFRRKPYWLTESLLNVDNKAVDEHENALPQEEPNSDGEYEETDTEASEYVLT
jgi:hypothetical protein